jgi:hypothetical protein
VVPYSARRHLGAQVARFQRVRLRRELARIAADPRPIFAGPWLGEVGFELLYWVPFLRWFAETFSIAPERLIVVSRGGTSSWYRPFAAEYREVFEHLTPEEFRRLHDERVRCAGEQKQTRVTPFELELMNEMARHSGTRGGNLLHPSLMYRAYNPYWWGHVGEGWVHTHADYRRLERPVNGPRPGLPSSYAAVKFYFNECFPATDRNRTFVREIIRDLAEEGPVVSLTTGLNLDDHGSVDIEHLDVRELPSGLAAGCNLHVQSAVVAGASVFVGTYGGFSYLAPFYGVRSIAYYSDPAGFSARHLAMARSAFAAIGSGALLELRPTEERERPAPHYQLVE